MRRDTLTVEEFMAHRDKTIVHLTDLLDKAKKGIIHPRPWMLETKTIKLNKVYKFGENPYNDKEFKLFLLKNKGIDIKITPYTTNMYINKNSWIASIEGFRVEGTITTIVNEVPLYKVKEKVKKYISSIVYTNKYDRYKGVDCKLMDLFKNHQIDFNTLKEMCLRDCEL